MVFIQTVKRKFWAFIVQPRHMLLAGVSISLIIFTVLISAFPASSAPILTVTPITWNVIGLDSNNVDVGPNNFPVGVRVCNELLVDDATNVTATFFWDDGNNKYTGDAYINLRSGSLDAISIPTLAARTVSTPSCSDFYFEATVTRDGPPGEVSYDKTRAYHIDITSDSRGIGHYSTTSRELYVEYLISQSRNSTTDIQLDGSSDRAGGTMVLMVGSTYDITLTARRPPTATSRSRPSSTSPTRSFRSTALRRLIPPTVTGSPDPMRATNSMPMAAAGRTTRIHPITAPAWVTGKYGGNVVVNYNVTIIGGGGTSETLNSA